MARFDFRELVERLPLVVYVDKLDEQQLAALHQPRDRAAARLHAGGVARRPRSLLEVSAPGGPRARAAAIVERNAGRQGADRLPDYRLITSGRARGLGPRRRGDRRRRERRRAGVPGVHAGRDLAAARQHPAGASRRHPRPRRRGAPPEEIVAEAARMLASAVGDVNVSFVAIEPGPTLRARYSTEHNGPLPDTTRVIPGYIERLEDGPIVVADVTEEAWLTGAQAELDQHRIGSAVDVPLPGTASSSACSGSTRPGRAMGRTRGDGARPRSPSSSRPCSATPSATRSEGAPSATSAAATRSSRRSAMRPSTS